MISSEEAKQRAELARRRGKTLATIGEAVGRGVLENTKKGDPKRKKACKALESVVARVKLYKQEAEFYASLAG